jgi:UDP-N-acetylmuramoyl-tripeptide--D-alanyl-D-alanine ligase
LEFIEADLDILYKAKDLITENCARGSFREIGGRKIYDDTYSSSPEAVTATFKRLSLSDHKTKSCVLGDMLELGEETEALHEKIGREAFEFGYKSIFAFNFKDRHINNF